MTTPVQNRWWAPTDPGIGPDEFDLELLQPGDDPSADLGQAFLALHRVGAAACEAVATQPLADESTLAFALANARRLVAPEASTIVSKAVGDDPGYGNLLLRDVLDDAEAAALSLWRSCIAKSVPAPVAAQRVGMVYGLPAGALYRFQKAATDPKTNHVALADIADRALFDHLAKVVKDEAVDRKVEVSKMTAEEWNRTEAGSKHPKAPATGRFARVANRDQPTIAGMDVTSWLSAQMATADTPAPEKVATPAVDRPTLRKPNRAKHGKHAKRPTSPKLDTKMSSGMLGTTLSTKIKGLLEASKLSALLDAQNDVPPNPTLDVTRNLSRIPRSPGDVTKRFPDQDDWSLQGIPGPIAYVLPTDEATPFVAAAKKTPDGKAFLAGRLTEYAGDPEIFRDEEYTGDLRDQTDEHLRNLRGVIEIMRQDKEVGKQPPKQVEYVDSSEIDFSDKESVLQHKLDFLAKLGVPETQRRTEVVFVDDAVNIDDYGQVALVYSPPPADRTRLASRPKIDVTEIIVTGGELRGHLEGTGRHETWIPERNAGLAFREGAFEDLNATRFWDNEMQAFRTWRIAVVTDELDDIEKAMTPDQFRQAEKQGLEGRDENGLFIGHILRQLEEQGMTAAPVDRPRPKRAKHARYAKRPQRPDAPKLGGKISTGLGSKMGNKLDTKINAARDRLRLEVHDIPGLVPGDYTALMYDEPVGYGFSRVEVSPSMRRTLERADVYDALDVERMVFTTHLDEHRDATSGHTKLIFHRTEATAEDMSDLAWEIWSAMERDPDFTVLRYSLKANPDDHTVDIGILRNLHPIGARDVVRWPPGMRRSDLRSLRPAERTKLLTPEEIVAELRQAFDSAHNSPTGNDKGYLMNPEVRVWEASKD